MKNVIIATARNSHVRIYLANTKNIVEQARIYHGLYPTSCAALGRTLSVTGLMGIMQKEKDETVTVTINGGGPIGTVMCVGTSEGIVKGFVSNPEFYQTYDNTHKLAVGVGVGTNGYLKVTKNLHLKQNYSSQVELQSGEIGDDFAYYFSVSEQVPTIVSVGVLINTDYTVKSAGAMIIELLPNHSEEDIQYLENLSLTPISSVLANNDDLHQYLNSLFDDAVILSERCIEYKCDCSKERFLRNLLTLPKKDLIDLAKDPKITVKCEFCDKEYEFTKQDIEKLLTYVQDK